jgi:hypothetical protein
MIDGEAVVIDGHLQLTNGCASRSGSQEAGQLRAAAMALEACIRRP